ncbi:MAG TPA: TadE/TadG family type IV pilus assembly protein [Caulobacteraceae bacterium]
MFVKRFARDVSAVAAIEFAFIAPVLIIMYFGLAEMTEAMIAQRRVAHTASTVGDLVAQSSTMTPSEISDIFTVGQAIVAPFPIAPLEMRVSSVTTDASDKATVDWSEGSGMAPLAKGSTVVMPATAMSASQSVVMSEVQYVYTSPVNYFLTSPITFSNVYYLHPRISNQVACATC